MESKAFHCGETSRYVERRLWAKQSTVSTIALCAALSGSVFFMPAVAVAQQTAASASFMDEIVITATRRETGLQDVGVSVTAFTADALREMNVVKTEDIATMTPGLSIIQPGGGQVAGLISIRGVSQNDFAAHLESANVLYVDDVYRPANGSNLQTMFDVERVEVLKGPQGTLFGRNATGGLVHLVTKDPTRELEGYAQLTLGEYSLVSVESAINIPLGEKVALRLAGYGSHNDGWIKNDIGPDQLEEDILSFRGKLLIEPNENLRVKLQGEWYRNSPNPAGGAYATGGFVGPDTLGQFRPDGRTDTGYLDADGSPFTGSFDYPGYFEREETTLIADISYNFGNLTFASISAYSDFMINYSEDNDQTPFDIARFDQNTKQKNFTQELRLSGDYDDFRFTTGAYYLHIDGDYFQQYQINNLGNYNEILAPIPVLLIPLGMRQYADYGVKTKSWSLFAQGEYDLSDQFTVTAGLRYTRDKKNYRYQNFCEELLPSPACAPADPDTIAGAGLLTDRHSEGGISARLQLDYKVTDEWLLFAAYNRGYKAFNYNAGFSGAASIAGVRFDGEKLNAFEVGSKVDFWDGRARFNVSGFYYDYKDYQAFDQRGVNFILSNTDARIYGADAELTLRPGHGINVLLGVSLVNTNVKDIPVAGQLLDRKAPQAPEFTFNFAASKDFTIDAGTIRVGFDGAYTDGYFSQLTNAPVTEVDSNWLVNTRISFTPESENWELAFFVRNIFNDHRLLYAFDITYPGNGLVKQSYGPPRWIGGQLRINF